MERDLADFFGHLGLRARLVFRVCVATLYFEHPDAAREIGWDQECLEP